MILGACSLVSVGPAIPLLGQFGACAESCGSPRRLHRRPCFPPDWAFDMYLQQTRPLAQTLGLAFEDEAARQHHIELVLPAGRLENASICLQLPPPVYENHIVVSAICCKPASVRLIYFCSGFPSTDSIALPTFSRPHQKHYPPPVISTLRGIGPDALTLALALRTFVFVRFCRRESDYPRRMPDCRTAAPAPFALQVPLPPLLPPAHIFAAPFALQVPTQAREWNTLVSFCHIKARIARVFIFALDGAVGASTVGLC